MWDTILACFNGIALGNIVGTGNSEAPNFVYRDALCQKPLAGKRRRSSNSEPLLRGEDRKKDFERSSCGGVKDKGVVRVKVLMTKEEAARLLSKCKEGGTLEFRDVAREIVQIPVNRVSVVSLASTAAKAPVLETINEEM